MCLIRMFPKYIALVLGSDTIVVVIKETHTRFKFDNFINLDYKTLRRTFMYLYVKFNLMSPIKVYKYICNNMRLSKMFKQCSVGSLISFFTWQIDTTLYNFIGFSNTMFELKVGVYLNYKESLFLNKSQIVHEGNVIDRIIIEMWC